RFFPRSAIWPGGPGAASDAHAWRPHSVGKPSRTTASAAAPLPRHPAGRRVWGGASLRPHRGRTGWAPRRPGHTVGSPATPGLGLAPADRDHRRVLAVLRYL